MQRLLLTQHQVKILLSLFLVLTTISILFAVGARYQSLSARSIRSSIVPPTPAGPLSPNAIVLPILDHAHLCSAIMAVADLPREVRKILLFPASWAEGGVGNDPYLSTARGMLRRAVRRWGVEIKPVEDVMLLQRPIWAVSRTEGVQRAVVLRLPGMVSDETRLLGLVRGDGGDGSLGVARGPEDVLETLVLDGKSVREALDGIADTKPGRSPLDSEEVDVLLARRSALVQDLNETTASLAQLRNVSAEEDLNADEWRKKAAWITFTDPLLPLGPEVEVPFDQKLLARPRNKAADWLWTSLYGDFAERRREICGLGLEPMYE